MYNHRLIYVQVYELPVSFRLIARGNIFFSVWLNMILINFTEEKRKKGKVGSK